MDTDVNNLKAMIRKSRELAVQSHRLRLRSGELMAETETLLGESRQETKGSFRKRVSCHDVKSGRLNSTLD